MTSYLEHTPAMIDFEPTEDQRLMQDSVAQFAKSTLAPRVREFERLRAVPEDVRRLAHAMGLGLIAVPEACGGQGQGLVTAVLIEEELGSADAAAAFGLSGPGAFAAAVVELGTEEQAKAALEDFGAEDGHSRFGASPRPTSSARAF
jgi:acyl-CoA dehydrogenase